MAPVMSLIRSFNRQGIEEFRAVIQQFADGAIGSVPEELLSSDRFSSIVPGSVQIEQRAFTEKIDAARYLTPRIEHLQIANRYYATGLWAWLSAFYFDSVCPPLDDGTRSPSPDYAYIPNESRNVLHRHLLALPVRIYRMHGDLPKLILYSPTEQRNEFINELAFRQYLAMNRGVLEAANLLYWDEGLQKPRTGATNKRRSGSLRRFVNVIAQLDLTYDLQSMSGNQIVQLLPPHEFADWLGLMTIPLLDAFGVR